MYRLLTVLALSLLANACSNASAQTAIWSMGAPPTAANSRDDEFNGQLSASWTLGAGALGTAIDPYAAFATNPGEFRYSANSYRKGWLMIQPVADGTGFLPFHKAITLATNEFCYARMSFMNKGNSGANQADIGLQFAADAAGSPDQDNRIQMLISETDANSYDLEFFEREGASNNTVQTTAQASPGTGIDSVGLAKIGTTWHGWAFSANGNSFYMGSTTFAATIAHVSIIVSDAGAAAPGNSILGVDFFRCVASATFLP